MLSRKIRTIIVSTVALAAVAVPATASAAFRTGGLTVRPVAVKTVVALEAFPTGKGTVEEQETCDEWTHVLKEDQVQVSSAVESNNLKQYIAAEKELSADVNGALDAGCGVID